VETLLGRRFDELKLVSNGTYDLSGVQVYGCSTSNCQMEERARHRQVLRLQKNAASFGYQLTPT
jgi:hypothetical protein